MYTASFRIIAVLLALLAMLAIFAGAIILQIFLSKKDNKWFGLILPGVSLIFSFIAVLGLVAFTPTHGMTMVMVNGEIIEQTTMQLENTMPNIINAIGIFLLLNIPTAALLIIYAVCRSKQHSKRALDKMSVHDLE